LIINIQRLSSIYFKSNPDQFINIYEMIKIKLHRLYSG
jgi:hypothetical protein